MTELDTARRPYPTCPHCGYSLDADDMNSISRDDLWALVRNEERSAVKCPQCDAEYWVTDPIVAAIERLERTIVSAIPADKRLWTADSCAQYLGYCPFGCAAAAPESDRMTFSIRW